MPKFKSCDADMVCVNMFLSGTISSDLLENKQLSFLSLHCNAFSSVHSDGRRDVDDIYDCHSSGDESNNSTCHDVSKLSIVHILSDPASTGSTGSTVHIMSGHRHRHRLHHAHCRRQNYHVI